jgi:hypothetical protein
MGIEEIGAKARLAVVERKSRELSDLQASIELDMGKAVDGGYERIRALVPVEHVNAISAWVTAAGGMRWTCEVQGDVGLFTIYPGEVSVGGE